VAIVGANGAGNRRFFFLNGCLMPQAGTVRIRDLPVSKRTLPDVRRTVGMVFQDPDDQLFMPTVYEDVAFGPLNLGLPAEEVDRRVMHALSIVGAFISKTARRTGFHEKSAQSPSLGSPCRRRSRHG
jgi:cobalt/nickel transport system ATP-binding protein